MKGRGRPKKCAKKLNFNKPTVHSNTDDHPQDNSICDMREVLPEIFTENQTVQSDISIHILPENSTDHVVSTSDSNMNNYFVPITDDIINRKFPVQLENQANVCFFNSICQVFLQYT